MAVLTCDDLIKCAQVNYSMMVGAILSWGIAWPLIANRAGDWYPADLPNPGNNFQGAFAYHVFWSIALVSTPNHSHVPALQLQLLIWCGIESPQAC